MVNVFSCVSRFPMTALFVRDTDANRCICMDVGLAVAACVVYRRESMVWCEGKGKGPGRKVYTPIIMNHLCLHSHASTLNILAIWIRAPKSELMRRRRTRLPGDGTTDCDQVSVGVCGALATRLSDAAATQSQSNNEPKAVWKGGRQ